MSVLTDKMEMIAVKRQELHDMFTAAKTATGQLDMNSETLGKVNARHDEINKLGEEIKVARELEIVESENKKALDDSRQIVRNLPFAGSGEDDKHGVKAYKSLGDAFVESKAGKNKKTEVEIKDFDIKTTMTTAAGFAPEVTRTGHVQMSAQRPLRVIDIMPSSQTTQASVQYMEETTFTNNSAEIAENPAGTFGEAALAFTERTVPVRKIATFLPVTDEQLLDEPRIRDIINNRLQYMVMARLDSQILQGDGNAPNLNGFYNQVTQVQAKGADPVPDAIHKGIYLANYTGFGNANAVIFHPNDWQDVRLLRTVEGIYIWGNPSQNSPDMIWGLNAVITTAATENTALVGDFLVHSELVYRSGVEFEVSNSHSDFFVKGLQAIRATVRAALVVYRPAAFCEVTGI